MNCPKEMVFMSNDGYRQKVEVDGRQGPVNRQKFLVDRDIPIFASSESDGWWSRFLK